MWEDICGECISLIDSLTCRITGRKDIPPVPVTMTIEQTPGQGECHSLMNLICLLIRAALL